MAVDTALFVLGLDTVGLPVPFADANFKSNVYSLNGATKTLADLFTLSIFTGNASNISVLTGVGFKCEYAGASSASGQLVATPALFAALTPAAGFTAVIDASATVGDGPSDLCDIEVQLADSNTGEAASLDILGGRGLGATPSPGIQIVDRAYAQPYAILAPYSNGTHKAVISFDPANLIGAADGGATVTANPFASQATTSRFVIYLESVLNANMIVQRVRFYRLITDGRILRQLVS